MSRSYKKPLAQGGSRMIKRDAQGRFSNATLSDMGVNICECCGGFFPIDLAKFDKQWPIDPRELNAERNRKRCDACMTLSAEEQERMAQDRRHNIQHQLNERNTS